MFKKDDILFGLNDISQAAGVEFVFKVKEYIEDTNTVITDTCLTVLKQPTGGGSMSILPLGNLGFISNVDSITEDRSDIYINLDKLAAYGKCTNTKIIDALEQVNSKIVTNVSENATKAIFGEDQSDINSGLHFVG